MVTGRTTLVAALAVGLALGPATAGAIPTRATTTKLEVPEAVRRALPSCACEVDQAELRAEYQRIAAAGSLEEARDRALSHIRAAQRALSTARWLAPRSEDLRVAADNLSAYEQRVNATESPGEAAAEFGELVQLASLRGPVLADVDVGNDGGGGCHYSTGEVIAIVLGLILGIIPGIILLILLC